MSSLSLILLAGAVLVSLLLYPIIQRRILRRTPAPSPAPRTKSPSAERPPDAPQLRPSLVDDDEDITRLTLNPVSPLNAVMTSLGEKVGIQGVPQIHPTDEDQDEEEDSGNSLDDGELPVAVFYETEAAAFDEPTRVIPSILTTVASGSDCGLLRHRNEDRVLMLRKQHVFGVADGMGGHAGGDVASQLAVETISRMFTTSTFPTNPYPEVPRRGAELALAIQAANSAVYEHARSNHTYKGMGTTVVIARFSPFKQRLYVGYVGDSRCYRLREGTMTQVTTDHTLAADGVKGPLANRLKRAVGIGRTVKVDLITVRPEPEDIYMLCTDGLNKMVPDEDIKEIVLAEPKLEKAVQKLVNEANARGGHDNVTVVLVRVKRWTRPPKQASSAEQAAQAPSKSAEGSSQSD